MAEPADADDHSSVDLPRICSSKWVGYRGHVTRFPLSAVIGSWSKGEVGVKHDLWKWAVGRDRHFVHSFGVWLGCTRVSGALSKENQGEQNR